jgi:tetratricopeptide (TPR) repeat protein
MSEIGQPGRLIAALAFWSVLVWTGSARAGEAQEYADCLDRAERSPRTAFERALAWRDEGGGFAARHCAAVALVAAEHYPDAADRLERLAEDMHAAGHPRTAETLAQAGNAWLLAGFNERAVFVFTAALGLVPNNPDLLIDRARAHAAAERYDQAAADLDLALAGAPERVDALVYRASARRRLDRLGDAAEDLAVALALDADHPEGLLERGMVRLALGDPAAARRDWLRLLDVMPEGPTAELARTNLEKLDVKSK